MTATSGQSTACIAATTIRPGSLTAEASDADLGEVDHRHQVVLRHGAVVELAQERGELLDVADLWVVVLDLAGRHLVQRLDLDLVDDRVEDLLAHVEALTGKDADDHPLAVLPGFVPQP